MFRKTVLATAIIGAGLGSMTGAAWAGEAPSGDHHGQEKSHDGDHGKSHDGGGEGRQASSGGCTNAVAASSENGAGRTTGDTTGGDQAFDASNVCNFLNGNAVLNGNNVSLGGSSIVNGDNTTETSTITETVTETVNSTIG